MFFEPTITLDDLDAATPPTANRELPVSPQPQAAAAVASPPVSPATGPRRSSTAVPVIAVARDADDDDDDPDVDSAAVDVDGLSEQDWCLYHRLPDIIQELAYNMVIDRPDDVDLYARGWLLDLKRQMVMNGNASCAQGVSLTSVDAERGLRLGGDVGATLPLIQVVEPDVAARAKSNATTALVNKVAKAQRKASRHRASRLQARRSPLSPRVRRLRSSCWIKWMTIRCPRAE